MSKIQQMFLIISKRSFSIFFLIEHWWTGAFEKLSLIPLLTSPDLFIWRCHVETCSFRVFQLLTLMFFFKSIQMIQMTPLEVIIRKRVCQILSYPHLFNFIYLEFGVLINEDSRLRIKIVCWMDGLALIFVFRIWFFGKNFLSTFLLKLKYFLICFFFLGIPQTPTEIPHHYDYLYLSKKNYYKLPYDI